MLIASQTAPTLQSCYLAIRAKTPTMKPWQAKESARYRLRQESSIFENGGYASNAEAWRHNIKHDMVPFALISQNRPQDKYSKGKGVFPRPIYVALFSDGSERRVSFWSRQGKSIDFAAGYNVAMLLGRAIPVSGHVEHDGQVMLDPHFTPQTVVTKVAKDSPAKKLAAIVRALNEGEIEAALIMAKAA